VETAQKWLGWNRIRKKLKKRREGKQTRNNFVMFFKQSTYAVESVREGHPDKVCDQISDAVLDGCINQDPKSRVAVESFGSHGLVVVGGEITTKAWVDINSIVSSLLRKIGYENHYGVVSNIINQSQEIARGVDAGGAGDQGIMYGYATDETPEYLNRGVVLAHKIVKKLDELKTDKDFKWLRPDGKAEVVVQNGQIIKILVSVQHDERVSQAHIKEQISRKVIMPLEVDIEKTELLINPAGKFIVGGFDADTGLTGRKIMVDSYGGLVPQGGGCFSGKDPTKVDRSAAYMCRFVAKNIVANNLAKECLVSVAYAIGKADPLMIEVTNENGESLNDVINDKFDFRPAAIIERLNLLRPIYQQTATYGHFGRVGVPWEEIISL